MTIKDKVLWLVLYFLVVLLFTIFHIKDARAAAPAVKAQGPYYIAVPPVQITNHLTIRNGLNFVRPYLKVQSKKMSDQVCQWMPRLRDAFFIALNSHTQTVSSRPVGIQSINTLLKQRAYRVTPKNSVIDVIAVDLYDPKSRQIESELKNKVICKKKKK